MRQAIRARGDGWRAGCAGGRWASVVSITPPASWPKLCLCSKKESPVEAGQVPGSAYVRTALGDSGGVGADQLALLKAITHRQSSGCDGHHILAQFEIVGRG